MRYTREETLVRVRRAFKVMRRVGVIVRAGFGCSEECAIDQLGPEIEKRHAPGAVYYTQADLRFFQQYGRLTVRILSASPLEAPNTFKVKVWEVLIEAGLEFDRDGFWSVEIQSSDSPIGQEGRYESPI